MQFTRKKKRGQNAKVRRTWYSEEGYRIVWRKEVYGVEMPPRFFATVRVVVPNYGQDIHAPTFDSERPVAKTFLMWDFVDHKHHLYKTMKAAVDACEQHKRRWTKACEATGIRGLQEIFGRVPSAYPTWVRKKLPRKVSEVLTRPINVTYEDEEECLEPSPPDGSAPSQSDPIRISPSLFKNNSVSELPESGPALSAEEEAPSTTRTTRRARSKATAIGEKSPAPPAEAAAKGRKPRASKPTDESSKSTKRKPTSTKGSSKPAKKRSAGSRKKKSKPSKS